MADDNDPSISLVLRTARAVSGLTQTQLAYAIGCSKATVSLVESEKREPSWPLISAWIDSCGFGLAEAIRLGESAMLSQRRRDG